MKMTMTSAKQVAEETASTLEADYLKAVKEWERLDEDSMERYDEEREWWDGLGARWLIDEYGTPSLELMLGFGGPNVWVVVPQHGGWVTVHAAWWSAPVSVEVYAPAYADAARNFYEEMAPLECRECRQELDWDYPFSGLCDDCAAALSCDDCGTSVNDVSGDERERVENGGPFYCDRCTDSHLEEMAGV